MLFLIFAIVYVFAMMDNAIINIPKFVECPCDCSMVRIVIEFCAAQSSSIERRGSTASPSGRHLS